MPIPPKYPMTDFHEINLDYLLKKYFEIDEELKAQIGGLVLDNQFNKLRLLDKDGNEITSVTVAYATNAVLAQTAVNATNAQNATLAARATEADNADLARYDAAGNQITSYLKTVETGVNSIVFKDAYNRIMGSVSIVEGSNLVINTETTAQSMAEIVENMDVGDEFVLTSDATIEQIYAAQAAGNVCLFRHYSVSSSDPDNKTLDYCQPLMDNGEATSFNLFVSGANHYFTFEQMEPPLVGQLRFRRYL